MIEDCCRRVNNNDDMHATLASEAPVLYRVTVAKNAISTDTGETVEIPVEELVILGKS